MALRFRTVSRTRQDAFGIDRSYDELANSCFLARVLMSDPLPWLAGEIRQLHERGLARGRRQVTPLKDGWCQIDGKRLRNFADNDYLGLASHPRVVEAAKTALESAGAGARASALISGRTDWHVRLEERLTRFEDAQAAIVFPTGYAANLGTLTALAGPEDALFCDRLNHASLIDGCRLSGAKLRVYRHNELAKLQRELRKAAGFRHRFLVTDAVFSMDGDLAPLPQLCDLAKRYDAAVIVDEAHGTGVYGQCGRGVAEWLNVEDRVAVRIGTLSKAVGSLGGFVTGSPSLIDWLWNRARTGVFSTALPPSACAAACAAINVIVDEPHRRVELLQRSRRFRDLLQQSNIAIRSHDVGPIVPILIGEPDRTVEAARELENRGFLVGAIRPPTVPEGTSRLRISLSYSHQEDDLVRLAKTLAEVLGKGLCHQESGK